MFRASLCPSSGEQECARHTHIHKIPTMFSTHYYNKDTTALTAYSFVPLLLQCRTPYAAVHTLVLLMMDIMMPETCWDKSLIINIRLVAFCWSHSLHPTFMMHGHKSLKLVSQWPSAATFSSAWYLPLLCRLQWSSTAGGPGRVSSSSITNPSYRPTKRSPWATSLAILVAILVILFFPSIDLGTVDPTIHAQAILNPTFSSPSDTLYIRGCTVNCSSSPVMPSPCPLRNVLSFCNSEVPVLDTHYVCTIVHSWIFSWRL